MKLRQFWFAAFIVVSLKCIYKMVKHSQSVSSKSPRPTYGSPGILNTEATLTEHVNQKYMDDSENDVNAISNKVSVPLKKADDPKLPYRFNCSNIPFIKLGKHLGSGVSKNVYLGDFNGEKVVVKTSRLRGVILEKSIVCESETNPDKPEFLDNWCYGKRNNEVIKEIYLLNALHHQNIAPLLGYCLKTEFSNGNALLYRGVTTVEYLGRRVYQSDFDDMGWKERLRHLTELADLMYYLDHSPLGSVRQKAMLFRHFVFIDAHLSMIDMDSVALDEGGCRDPPTRKCELGTQCNTTTNKCDGFNAKSNLFVMYNIFSDLLIAPRHYPSQLKSAMEQINSRLAQYSFTTEELVKKLKEIDNLARNI